MTARPRWMTPIDRFTEKYEVDEHGCWLWTSTTARGYATFCVDGVKIRAARWIYEQVVGAIPEGCEIDHLCRVTRCVNPYHLEPVTHDENSRRARLTVCRAGLHDLTRVENRHPAVRGCYACRKAQMRRRYAEGRT